MPTTINRRTYEHLIQEDLEWLKKQPRSLERDHIEVILRQSADLYYPSCCDVYKRTEGDRHNPRCHAAWLRGEAVPSGPTRPIYPLSCEDVDV